MEIKYIPALLLAGAIFGSSSAKCATVKGAEDIWHPITIAIKSTQANLCGCGDSKSEPSDYFILMVQPKGVGEELTLEKAKTDGFIRNIKYDTDKGYPTSVSFEFNNKNFQDEYESLGHTVSSIVQMIFPGSHHLAPYCLSPQSVNLVDENGEWEGNPNSTIELKCPVK